MNPKAARAELNKFASVQFLADAQHHFRAGNLAEADAICRRVLASDPRNAQAHIMSGDISASAGKHDDAIRHYKRAVTLEPSNAEALNRLGLLRAFRGEREAALACYETALRHEPGNATTHIHLGDLYREMQRFGDAADSYVRAIEIQPERLETHIQLCDIMLLQGAFAAAAAHFEQIIAAAPRYLPAHNGLAAALLGAGNPGGALECCRRALAISDNERSRTLFVQALRTAPTIPASDDVRRMIVRAVSEPWARPSQLVPQCMVLIRADEEIAACMARADTAWPARLAPAELFGASGLAAMARNPVLRCLLENALVTYVNLERCLTNVRRALLDAALATEAGSETGDAPDDEILAFYCAVARQCFINEFIFDVTGEENAQVAMLRDQVTHALHDGSPIPALWIAGLAAYAPLCRLKDAARLLERTWTEPVAALLAQAVREPLDEAVLTRSIAQVTPIADANILAVDLSLASMAYASRKARELGLSNIAFGQADIMQLGRLSQRFDIVESSGVLHHLGDPEAGWRVLVSLLKPNGLMRISLYSEIARSIVVAAREFIAAQGYASTIEDIRRFRQDVLALPADHPVKAISFGRDFFSASECRDLAFHVQEQRFTLPRVKAFLAENQLEFLGFDVDLDALNKYTAQCPDDRARIDLDHWHLFEQANPDVFSGMYQFWVQKRG